MNNPIIDQFGTKRWRNADGQLHRDDGPATMWANGSKAWYINGQPHRTDGPAVENANGDKYWIINGKRHRTDGPAIMYGDSAKIWYLYGEYLTEKESNNYEKSHEHILNINYG